MENIAIHFVAGYLTCFVYHSISSFSFLMKYFCGCPGPPLTHSPQPFLSRSLILLLIISIAHSSPPFTAFFPQIIQFPFAICLLCHLCCLFIFLSPLCPAYRRRAGRRDNYIISTALRS